MRYRMLPFFLLVFACADAQTINVVPNPSAPDLFAWTGSGALSGYTGNPIAFNNKLVVEYNPSGTSDIYSSTRLQLAVYDGITYTLIPNPDAGGNVYFQSVHIIFDNKLFFIYVNQSNIQQMASFDGTSITLYPNPDNGPGFIGAFRIYNNELYGSYVNASNVTQYGKFNGSSLSLIPNPDNSIHGFEFNYSVIFGNKMVARYITASGTMQLATYNGTSWTILPNPDATASGVYASFPANYHDKLYWRYYSATGQYQYLMYDGTNDPTLLANPQNSSTNHGGVIAFPVVINDTLFFQYYNTSGIYQLAKFGGTSISLVPNPDSSPYGYWWVPSVYNNKLNVLYQTADGKRHLAEYQTTSNSLKIIANPEAGTGYWDYPIVFNDKLYIMYRNAQSVFQLAYFDGTAVKLVDNPGGIYNSSGNNGYMGSPIVFNNLLCMQFGSVPYGNAGNLASFNGNILPVTFVSFTGKLDGANALLSWSTTNETNNKGYQVQRSFDGINFSDIGFVKCAGSTTATNHYTYTDLKIATDNNFYRLKQIDNDGKFNYSTIISLDYTKFNWSVKGNASANNAWVQLQLDKNANVFVQVVSINGNVIGKINQNNLSTGSHAIPLNLANAGTGIYIIQVKIDGKTYSTKIMK